MSLEMKRIEEGNKLHLPKASKFDQLPLEPATTPSAPRWMRKNSQTPKSELYVPSKRNHPETLSVQHTNNSVDRCPAVQRPSKLKLYKGLLLASLSSVFFCLSSVIVKYVKELNPAQLASFRFVSILIFTTPVLCWSGESALGPGRLRHYLILRGFVGATNLFLRFVAFRYLPLADASIIVFSVPVFVTIFARIFLKEPCGIFQGITVCITLLGVFLITKMPLVLSKGISYKKEQIWGIIAAIASTLFGAAVYIVLRKLKSLHHSVVVFNFGWVATLETLVLASFFGFDLPKCGLNQGLLILLGVFSFCGQTLMTMALQTENAAPVSIIRAAVDIILAFFWQVLFFHEIPDGYSISGAILVSCCIFMVSIRKWVLSLPEESKIKKRVMDYC